MNNTQRIFATLYCLSMIAPIGLAFYDLDGRWRSAGPTWIDRGGAFAESHPFVAAAWPLSIIGSIAGLAATQPKLDEVGTP